MKALLGKVGHEGVLGKIRIGKTNGFDGIESDESFVDGDGEWREIEQAEEILKVAVPAMVV